MEVAVVGAGIVGLASAYYLGRDGHDVTVYEKGRVGNGSTERSAGGIRRQFATPVNVELSKASLEVWEAFEDEFGVEIDFRRPGYLFLARDPATAAHLERTVAMHHDHGVSTQLLDPEEATAVCPALRHPEFERATYLSEDGFADPHLALQGFVDKLPEVGVDLRTHTPVRDMMIGVGEGSSADRTVSGIVTAGQRHRVDVVVNAAGPWARRVARMAGVQLPVAPKRRHILVVEPDEPVPESVPLTIDLDTGAYFRPERDGAALVGGHFDDADPNAVPDRNHGTPETDYVVTALEHAAEVASYFGPETRLKRGWSGLYARTPDDHPIIEETIPGLVSAVGFSGHGFQHAPATGQLVAELVTNGEASLLDISSLSSDRFEDGSTINETYVA